MQEDYIDQKVIIVCYEKNYFGRFLQYGKRDSFFGVF
jgi:hypothetical protein